MLHRILFLGMCSVIAVSAAIPASVARINELLQAQSARLKEIRTAPVLHSRDADMVEEYLMYMIQQNPSIQTITKIGPDGTVLNRVSSEGASRQIASVANERWFARLCKTKQPCNGIARDNNRQPLLFCAWPIFESSGAAARMIGIFSVKIDIKKYLATQLKTESDPLLVHYKGAALFSSNWKGITNYLEEPVRHSCFEGLSVRYENREPEPSAQQVSAETESNSLAFFDNRNQENRQAPENAAGMREEKKASAYSASPDSRGAPATVASPKRNRLMEAGIIAGVVVVLIGGLFFALVRRSRVRQRRENDYCITRQSEPYEAILLDDGLCTQPVALAECRFIEETDMLEECAPFESETRELPVLQELVAESSENHC